MNEAINQTLSRTILTSLSTLAVLVCLYFFGGPPWKTRLDDFRRHFDWYVLLHLHRFSAALFFSRKHGLHEEVRQAMKAGA